MNLSVILFQGKKVFGERKDRNRPASSAKIKPCAEEELDTTDFSAHVKRPPSTKRIVEIKVNVVIPNLMLCSCVFIK